ncbi:hypothetical protein F8C00_19495 [Escherichia coli]|nr:hypothetical protein [Escherichia coli]
MLPSETMIWQPEFTDKTLSRKPGAVQALSLLLTQQSAQFTIRRNGVPRLINVSVGELTGMNGLRHERTQ